MSRTLADLTALAAKVSDMYERETGVRRDDDWYALKMQEELGECYLALGDAERARGHFARAYAELGKDAGLASKEGERLQRIGRLGGVEGVLKSP